MNDGIAERVLSERRFPTRSVTDGGMGHGIRGVASHRLVLETIIIGGGQ